MNNANECPGRDAYLKNIAAAAEVVCGGDALKGSTILLTGATGLIGGMLARVFMYLNRVHGSDIRLICPVRSMAKAKTALDGIFDRREMNIFEADAENLPEIYGPVDYIIHTASPTGSGYFAQYPLETINSITGSTRELMSLAVQKQVKGMVYLSSMEAYGVVDSAKPRNEGELGSISLDSTRSCYGESKRLCELMIRCLYSEYGIRACSARLAQTFGAGVTESENRVFMQFARSALKGENLVLHTRGLSTGNYVHIADCAAAVITLLVKGAGGEAYNVCGDGCSMTIRELAESTNRLLNPGGSVITDIPEAPASLGYAPDTKLVLDNSKLKQLGWQPRFGIDDMITSLAADINGRSI